MQDSGTVIHSDLARTISVNNQKGWAYLVCCMVQVRRRTRSITLKFAVGILRLRFPLGLNLVVITCHRISAYLHTCSILHLTFVRCYYFLAFACGTTLHKTPRHQRCRGFIWLRQVAVLQSSKDGCNGLSGRKVALTEGRCTISSDISFDVAVREVV